MKGFYDALRESIITQALLTVMIVGAWLYMVVSGQTPPDEMTQAMILILGFYFGSKSGFIQGRNSILPLLPKRYDDLQNVTPPRKRVKTRILGKDK